MHMHNVHIYLYMIYMSKQIIINQIIPVDYAVPDKYHYKNDKIPIVGMVRIHP